MTCIDNSTSKICTSLHSMIAVYITNNYVPAIVSDAHIQQLQLLELQQPAQLPVALDSASMVQLFVPDVQFGSNDICDLGTYNGELLNLSVTVHRALKQYFVQLVPTIAPSWHGDISSIVNFLFDRYKVGGASLPLVQADGSVRKQFVDAPTHICIGNGTVEVQRFVIDLLKMDVEERCTCMYPLFENIGPLYVPLKNPNYVLEFRPGTAQVYFLATAALDSSVQLTFKPGPMHYGVSLNCTTLKAWKTRYPAFNIQIATAAEYILYFFYGCTMYTVPLNDAQFTWCCRHVFGHLSRPELEGENAWRLCTSYNFEAEAVIDLLANAYAQRTNISQR